MGQELVEFVTECSALRERNQVNGSTFANSHEATKLRNRAAVLPPPSLPREVRLARPTAKQRCPFGVMVIDR